MSAEWCARDTALHAGLFSLGRGTEQRRAIAKTLRVVAVAVSSGGHVEWLRACGGRQMLVTRALDVNMSTTSTVFKGNEVSNVSFRFVRYLVWCVHVSKVAGYTHID